MVRDGAPVAGGPPVSPWLAFLLGASAGACLAVLILGALQSRLRYIEIIQMDVETGQLAG